MRSVFIAITTMALSGSAWAQEQRLSDAQVAGVLMLALDNIARATCGSPAPCAPATPQEKAAPPIAIDEARAVMARGMLSEAGQQCGLDWQTANFLPMMTYWRHVRKKNERQMALIGLVHGITQGLSRSDTAMVCTTQMRETVARQLPFAP